MLSLSPYQAWSMWAVATLFYAYQYVLRVLPTVIREELLVHFNTNALEFGQFAGLYYLSYSLMHIPLAIWLDRKNPKYIIPLCILATVGGIVPLLISDTIAAANIGRFIMGIGSSGAILGVFKVIRLGFPESHFNRMLGLSVTVGLVGALYGGLPVRTLLETTHWQDIVLYFCWIGGFLAVLAFVVIPSKYKPIISTHNIMDDIIQVLKNKNVLMVCICAGLMLGPLEGFADVWGAGFLQSVYQIAPAKAAGISSLMFLGMLFGAPGLTYMADYLKAHIKIIIGAALFMGTVFVTMLYGFGSPEMLSVLFTAVGVACAYQIIAIYVASTYVRERHVSITTALANMIIMTFGYFFHTVIGIMMGDHQSGGNFSHEQYQYGLSIIPICLFIAAIGFMIQLKRNKA
jgi:predicted MFS family arabinose efflux permease